MHFGAIQIYNSSTLDSSWNLKPSVMEGLVNDQNGAPQPLKKFVSTLTRVGNL
jgi:hypothetical protein